MLCLGLLVCNGGVAQATTAKKQLAARCKAAVLIGHRGEPGRYGGKYHDENTISSFAGAAKRGADEVETDLRVTKDGVWVLMHDAKVDRTTNGHGLVSKLTYEKISQLKTTHGDHVPTVEELITTFQDTKLNFQLELKPQPVGKAKLAELVQMLQDHGVLERATFSSTSGNMLLRIRELAPHNKTGYIGGIAGNPTRPSIALLKKYKANSANISFRALTKDYAKKLRQHGYKVSARSTATPAQYKAVVTKGAARIVTDHTKGYSTWCRRV